MTSPPSDLNMRLFVALEMPPAWRSALGEVQDRMREVLEAQPGEPTRLRWTRPEGIHLTFKFLGETPHAMTAPLDQALSNLVKSARGFELSLSKLGSFGDRRGPRVVYAEVDGETEALVLLANNIDEALVATGFPRERRPLQPHLTLARLPERISPAQGQAIASAIGATATPRLGPHAFREISLMQSHLGRGGARYERLKSFSLR